MTEPVIDETMAALEREVGVAEGETLCRPPISPSDSAASRHWTR